MIAPRAANAYIVAVATASGDTEPIEEISSWIARWIRVND